MIAFEEALAVFKYMPCCPGLLIRDKRHTFNANYSTRAFVCKGGLFFGEMNCWLDRSERTPTGDDNREGGRKGKRAVAAACCWHLRLWKSIFSCCGEGDHDIRHLPPTSPPALLLAYVSAVVMAGAWAQGKIKLLAVCKHNHVVLPHQAFWYGVLLSNRTILDGCTRLSRTIYLCWLSGQ